MKHLVKQSILAGGTFAGGVVAGFLMGSRRAEVQKAFDSTKEKSKIMVDSVLNRTNRYSELGKVRLNALKTDLAKNFKDPIPDLYKATESLTIDDLELKLPR
ncbi:hypothetical protein [Rhodohalobacter sp.]|uniref:hypothetical protein n=1 Tax=Rhodohalobacter sp. TaxID=1974210 RepID=UPI002ACD3488|nr:hypothetical protein [Rhodohalobacter sp.]MDZ7758379.1 hypothetical protein [Rhodohalobacter sp.]